MLSSMLGTLKVSSNSSQIPRWDDQSLHVSMAPGIEKKHIRTIKNVSETDFEVETLGKKSVSLQVVYIYMYILLSFF